MDELANFIQFIEQLANHKCICLIDDCICFDEFQHMARSLICHHNETHKHLPLGICQCFRGNE